MILEKETELAKINKELKDLEHYKVSYKWPAACAVNRLESYDPVLIGFLLSLLMIHFLDNFFC